VAAPRPALHFPGNDVKAELVAKIGRPAMLPQRRSRSWPRTYQQPPSPEGRGHSDSYEVIATVVVKYRDETGNLGRTQGLGERIESILNLIASLALLAASAGLVYFGRGRDGKSRPVFRKNWILTQLYPRRYYVRSLPRERARPGSKA
jgi:hypothetical protein